MILPEKKIAYIHIPRTGGTSVERAMLLSMGSQITQFGAPLVLKKRHAMDVLHRPLSELERIYDLTDYDIYATHRDPVERRKSLERHTGGHMPSHPQKNIWDDDEHYTSSNMWHKVEMIPFEEMAERYSEILGITIPHLNASQKVKKCRKM